MQGILLETSGEIIRQTPVNIKVGNFSGVIYRVSTGDNNGQSIEQLVRANRGEFKELPFAGGEVVKHMGGRPDQVWCAKIKKQIKGVGLAVSRVSMNETEITIE